MQAAGELVAEHGVNAARARDPRLPAEHMRYNQHPVMCFAARGGTGMAGVAIGFVRHLQAFRGEMLPQQGGHAF